MGGSRGAGGGELRWVAGLPHQPMRPTLTVHRAGRSPAKAGSRRPGAARPVDLPVSHSPSLKVTPGEGYRRAGVQFVQF